MMSRLPTAFLFLIAFFSAVNGYAQSSNSEQLTSNYSLGVEAYTEGDFRRAFNAWSLGAYEGNTEAQYNLGVLYLEGRGIERNLEQARNWFLKAAEKNHVEAQYNLGHLSLSGMGVEKSVQVALHWWKLSAEGGYAPAQFNYGRALYLGVEGLNDKSAGVEFMRLSAAQDEPRALEFLSENVQDISKLSVDGTKTSSPVELVVADVPDQAPGDAQQALPASQASEVKVRIIRDQSTVQHNYLMRSADVPVMVYQQADLQLPVGEIAPGSILMVIDIEGSKVQVVSEPSSSNGWIEARHLAYSGESSQQLKAAWDTAMQPKNPSTELIITPELTTLDIVISDEAPESLRELPSGLITTPKKNEGLGKPEKYAAGSVENLHGAPVDDNAWLFTQEPGTYVIHLFTLLDFDKALSVSTQAHFRAQAHLYTTYAKNQRWTFLLLGPYANVAAAKTARSDLPNHYAKYAQVRNLARIAGNRCAKRESLDELQSKGLQDYCL